MKPLYMRFAPLVIAAPLLLMSAVSAGAGSWADGKSDPSFAKSKQICKSVATVDIAEPGPLDKATPCDSEALYYGIGMKADPAAARRCAAREARGPDANEVPFGGNGLLMMMYANGIGVKRDFNRAIALACQLDGAEAEMDGRVQHLARLRAEGWTGNDFSVCDDATSGLLAGICEAHASRIENIRRKQTITTLSKDWSEPQKAALARLQTASATYANAVGNNEVDLSGTLRAALQIDATDAVSKAFQNDLRQLVNGKLKKFSTQQLAQSDAVLNTTYQKVMHTKDFSYGTVKQSGIRDTQRAWLAYRDAFATFVGDAFPDRSADDIKGALTVERTAALREFLQ
ncbi:lysozyme inhibitor LprI family protein [Paraburkholderia agricolaris]|uniref:lysozyme inhibitor LprI family protein n=1 Tax=Paraburkholderia agricolaris TaxID=2152888 RepID=UPI0038B7DEE4